MAKKFKVKADKENIPDYDSELEIEVGDEYEAYFKGSIPEPSQFNDGASTITITWFNNFGVREIKSKGNADVEYTVKLKKIPAGKRLFVRAMDGTIHEVTSKNPGDADNKHLKYEDSDGGNIKFRWNVGDPPTGFGP